VTQLDFFVLQFVLEILEVPFKMFKALFQIGPVRLNVSFIVENGLFFGDCAIDEILHHFHELEQ
jgi:hypothetical protein